MFATYIVAGLGNPGREYKNTRHNMGFMIVEQFADHLGGKFKKHRSIAEISTVSLEGTTVLLVKPMTFMNNSGLAVNAALRQFKVDISQLLVVCDDIALPLGRMRLRGQGSSGGHNGLNSIISHLSTNEFARLRIGIGRDSDSREMTDYVLSSFSRKEKKILESIQPSAQWTIESFILNGLEKTMTITNSNKPNDAHI